MIDFEKIAETYKKLPHSGPCMPDSIQQGIALQREYARIKKKMSDLAVIIVEYMEDNWCYEDLVSAGYFGKENSSIHEASLRAEQKKKGNQ
jgi:hypothetical protein